ncbi:hypothetical protein [Pseudomonas sp. H3(2019)]|uniref:hypothetical protein n=1 Tax=Pseudomonas sp. H3(2019) TaxID=2598724 RepID=UPI00119624A2|nr:hypothetical protein [Pseudomonas sp. H3(2019)]TVT82564.1 hypothetical protein FPT12_15360 [Pseudomonas sp. H3(2019)]
MENHHSITCVCAGNVLLFSGVMSAFERQNVLDSSLYTQVATSRKFPAMSDFDQWQGAWRVGVRLSGWMVSEDNDETFPSFEQERFSVKELIEAGLAKHQGSQSERDITASLDAVSWSPLAMDLLRVHTVGHGAVTQGTEEFHDADNHSPTDQTTWVRVQAGVVSPGALLTQVTVCFETRETVDADFLRQAFSVHEVVGRVRVNCCVALLEEADHEPLREFFITRLGGLREEKILKLS